MQTAMMGAAWVTNHPAFALLVRYQAQARRDYFRALKQLELIRTGNAAYLPENSIDHTNPPQEVAKAATATAAAPAKPETANEPASAGLVAPALPPSSAPEPARSPSVPYPR